MMNRKGLLIIIREIFSFAFGILLLITTTFIFNNMIVSQIMLFSYNEQLNALVEDLNAVLINVEEQLVNGVNTTLVINTELPKSIVLSPYKVYVSGSELCGRTTGNLIITRCIPINARSIITGNYFSGTMMRITGVNNPTNGLVISFDNSL